MKPEKRTKLKTTRNSGATPQPTGARHSLGPGREGKKSVQIPRRTSGNADVAKPRVSSGTEVPIQASGSSGMEALTSAPVAVVNVSSRATLKRGVGGGDDDVEWVRRRAYELYLARQGRVGGSADDDWLQAERESRERVAVPEILFQ